jgi:hypothetical protein
MQRSSDDKLTEMSSRALATWFSCLTLRMTACLADSEDSAMAIGGEMRCARAAAVWIWVKEGVEEAALRGKEKQKRRKSNTVSQVNPGPREDYCLDFFLMCGWCARTNAHRL